MSGKSSDEQESAFRVQYCGTGLYIVSQHIGRFPTMEEGLSMLTQEPADAELKTKWRGPYVKEESLTDAWGRPIQLVKSESTPTGFDVVSLGADGQPSADDIRALDVKSLRDAFTAAVQQFGGAK